MSITTSWSIWEKPKMLEIRDLHVSVQGTPVLRGINLTIEAGETFILFGPNGAAGIIMDCNTGALLAIASLPNYDLNDYDAIYDTRLQQELAEAVGVSRQTMTDPVNIQCRKERVHVRGQILRHRSVNRTRSGRGAIQDPACRGRHLQEIPLSP